LILNAFLMRSTITQSHDEFESYCGQAPTAIDTEMEFNLVN